MAGYCNICHQPIIGDNYKFVKGKKVCLSCLAKQEQDKQDTQNKIRQLETDKEGLFSFLLSLFPLREIPSSWNNTVDSMIKKQFTPIGIKNTLQYCLNIGKDLTDSNWTALVYIYYEEAQKVEEDRQKILENNKQKILTNKVVNVTIHDTTYRDLPPFKMEDL